MQREAEEKRIKDAIKNDATLLPGLIADAEGIRKVKEKIVAKLGGKVSEEAVEQFIFQDVSLGKLTPLLFYENLEEIMVIGHGEPVYIYDKKKGMVKTDIVLNEQEIRALIERISKFSGRRIDGSAPLLDARLPDGSRVNATLQEITPRGSTITIRRAPKTPMVIPDLIRNNTVSAKLAAFLWVAVEGLGTKPANILILGGSATGKTTMLNALSFFIPSNERIISIEDTMEVSLMHEHWIPMEAKPPQPGMDNEVSMDALLKNALRMRPDRIIVGEVRAEEAMTMFTAMNTGHDGCLATIHANSAKEGITRLESHPMNVPAIMIPALDIIIAQRKQMEHGMLRRKVFEVMEVAGREGDNILTNTLFRYDSKKAMLEVKILNGRIIEELSRQTNLSIKEIDDEIEKREKILEVVAGSNLNSSDTHEFIQLYYRDEDAALDWLKSKSSAVR